MLSSSTLYPSATLTSPEITSYGFSMLPSPHMTGNQFLSSESEYSNYTNDDSNEYMSRFTSIISDDLQISILVSNNYQPDQSGDEGYHLTIVYASIAIFAGINWNHMSRNNIHVSVYIGLMILLCSVTLTIIFVLRCHNAKKGIHNYISL